MDNFVFYPFALLIPIAADMLGQLLEHNYDNWMEGAAIFDYLQGYH